MKQLYINSLAQHVGETIQEIFYLKNVLEKTTTKGKKYLELLLQDRTGYVSSKCWDMEIKEKVYSSKSQAVRIDGIVTQEYNGHIIIAVSSVQQSYDYQEQDLFNGINSERTQKYKELLYTCITHVENVAFKKLLEATFHEIEEKFIQIPASSRSYHCYNGGLLVYTISLVMTTIGICIDFQKYNETPMYAYTVDQDMVIMVGLLHSVGSVFELEALPDTIRKQPSYYLSTADITISYLSKVIEKKEIAMSTEEEGILFHMIKAVWDDNVKPMNLEGSLLNNIRRTMLQHSMLSYAYYKHNAQGIGAEYEESLKNYIYISGQCKKKEDKDV